jgi:polysaccharide biosynthesis protein PslJ
VSRVTTLTRDFVRDLSPASGRPARKARVPRDAVTLLSIYAFLLLLIPSRLVFAPLGGNGTPALVVGLVALVLWGAARRPENDTTLRARPVRFVILVYAVANITSYALAMLHALDPAEIRSADRSLLALGAAAGIALCAADGIPSRARLETLLTRVVIFASIGAAIAALQFFDFDLTRHFYLPGLHATSELGAGAVRSTFHRVAGTARHPIELGASLAMVLPLALHFAFKARGREKIWRWGCVALLGLAIPMSLSRTAIVGVLIVIIVLLPTYPPVRQRGAVLIGGAWTVMMWLAVPGLVGTLGSLFSNYGTDTSVTDRTARYSRIGGLLAHHVVFGRGLGTFIPEKYFVLDNQYIASTLEVGLVGLSALFLVMFVSYGCARGARRLFKDPVSRDLAQSLAAAASVPVVVFATFDALSFPMVPGLMFLLLGVNGALWRLARPAWRPTIAAARLPDRPVPDRPPSFPPGRQ